MDKQILPAEVWLEVALESMEEFVAGALVDTAMTIVEPGAGTPRGSAGAYVPMLASPDALQLGVLSTQPGCVALARALLGMEPEDEELSVADMVDAVGEVVNIVAGALQRRLAGRYPELSAIHLGLPIFIDGRVEHSGKMSASSAHVTIGDIPVEVVILKSR